VKTLLLGLILASMSFAADVVGRWTGTVTLISDSGEPRPQPALLIFKMEGDKLTGTGGPNEDRQIPFQVIKLEGDDLTFTVGDDDVKVDARLKVAGDSLTGEGKLERDGRTMVAKFDMKRSKG
jgi:hypothetical protein